VHSFISWLCNIFAVAFLLGKKPNTGKKNMKIRSINPNQHMKEKMNLQKEKIAARDLLDLTQIQNLNTNARLIRTRK
jgi:hypothetical protein